MPRSQLATRIDGKVKKAMEEVCRARGLKISRFVEDALLDKLEDLEDIEDIRKIRHEPTRPLEDIIRELKPSCMSMRLTIVIGLLLSACSGSSHEEDAGTEPIPDALEDSAPIDQIDDASYPDCEPQDPDSEIIANLSFDLEPPGGGHVDFKSNCSVSGIEVDGPSTTVGLDCEPAVGSIEAHTFTFTSSPAEPLDLDVGEAVQLDYSSWWMMVGIISWFILRDTTGDVILAVTHGALVHPDHPDWYDPMDVSLIEGLCPKQSGIYDCADIERQAIDVALGEDVARVFSGTAKTLGDLPGHAVIVPIALRYFEPYRCTDQWPYLNELAIVRRPP